MTRCKAKTKSGAQCAAAAGETGYCGLHNPAHGAARADGRRRGGERHRVPHAGDAGTVPAQVRTLDDVLKVLDYALAEAMPQENSVQRGRLLVQIVHAFVEAIKTGELEARLLAIEKALNLGGKNESHTTN